MTGAPDAAGELARRGARAARPTCVAMGVPAADLDALARRGAAAAGWSTPDGRRGAGGRLAAAVAAHDAADPLDPGLPRRGRPPGRRACPTRGWSRPCCAAPSADATGLVLRDGRVRRARRARAARRGARGAGRAARRPGARPRSPRPRPPASPSSGWARASSRRWSGRASCCASPTASSCCPAPTTGRSRCWPALGPEFTLSAARQALGTTRRVAVPLLELLARTGRTARTPDGGHRLVRARPDADRVGTAEWQAARGPYGDPRCPTHARTRPPIRPPPGGRRRRRPDHARGRTGPRRARS